MVKVFRKIFESLIIDESSHKVKRDSEIYSGIIGKNPPHIVKTSANGQNGSFAKIQFCLGTIEKTIDYDE